MSSAPPSQQPEETSGSPSTGGPDFLVIGQLRKPHGVRGEMLFSVWTDFPERLAPGISVYVGEDHHLLRLRSVRPNGTNLLLTFDGYSTPEAVGIFRNALVYARTADLPALDEGELYLHELLNLRVVEDETGAFLGVVVEILQTGANDVFVVQDGDGPELLLPDIETVVLQVDLQQGEMRVHLLPGLLNPR